MKEIPIFESGDNINSVKQDITSLENMLKADEQRHKIQDPEAVKSDIKTKEKYLKKITPKKMKGQKANKALGRLKELHDTIKKKMLPSEVISRPYPKGTDSHSKQLDFDRGVEQQIKFQTDPTIKKAVREYKALARQIDPDDKFISNIEYIRKDKGSKSYFFEGLDQIKWG